MLRPYFCAYHSYLENMELLNSEERGRLFTALLEYSKDGTLIPLTGNERFVFPGIRSQIDRDKEQWKKTDEQQASYGRKPNADADGSAVRLDRACESLDARYRVA